MSIRVVIQARMSSRRFPGKVLAPLHGQPVIRHVIVAVKKAVPTLPIVVATSVDASDDPLALYVDSMNVPVFRGDLNNVLKRFRDCASTYPCEWILRVCADSPCVSSQVIRAVLQEGENASCDLVTTRCPSTVSKGHNAELIKVSAMQLIRLEETTPDDREHVTPFFYRHKHRFRIINIETADTEVVRPDLCVDTVDDITRLEDLWDSSLRDAAYPNLRARVVSVGEEVKA